MSAWAAACHPNVWFDMRENEPEIRMFVQTIQLGECLPTRRNAWNMNEQRELAEESVEKSQRIESKWNER